MSLASEILARRVHLARAQTHDVVCEPDLHVTADDGAVLLADRWVSRATRDEPQPTVLVRSPYGRKQVFGLSPFDERADGLATLDWIREQPWVGDVAPDGMSRNVCDASRRDTPRRAPTGPGTSPSTSGRWATASRPGTASARSSLVVLPRFGG